MFNKGPFSDPLTNSTWYQHYYIQKYAFGLLPKTSKHSSGVKRWAQDPVVAGSNPAGGMCSFISSLHLD